MAMKEYTKGVFIAATSGPEPEPFTMAHLDAARQKLAGIMADNVRCTVTPSDSAWRPDPVPMPSFKNLVLASGCPPAAASALSGVLSLAKYPLITSSLLVDQITRQIRVPRSKKKRIRKKFHKLWTRTYTVPSQEVVVTNRFIVCHPAILSRLQTAIRRESPL